jgi:hypothetical protein
MMVPVKNQCSMSKRGAKWQLFMEGVERRRRESLERLSLGTAAE